MQDWHIINSRYFNFLLKSIGCLLMLKCLSCDYALLTFTNNNVASWLLNNVFTSGPQAPPLVRSTPRNHTQQYIINISLLWKFSVERMCFKLQDVTLTYGKEAAMYCNLKELWEERTIVYKGVKEWIWTKLVMNSWKYC